MAVIKIKSVALLLFPALFLTLSCSKQGEDGAVTGGRTKIVATLGPSGLSKVSMSPSSVSGGLDLSWQEGDAIMVEGEGQGLFTICPGFSAHQAEFEGTPVSGKSFTVYYPGNKYADVSAIKAKRFDSQIQRGNADTRHLEWNAIVEDAGEYSHIDFSSGLQTAVLKFVLNVPENVNSVSSLSFSASDSLFYVTNDAEGPVTDSLKLSFADVDLSSDRTLVAYMMTSWNDVVLPEGTRLSIIVDAVPDQKLRVKLSVPSGGLVIRGGKVNSIRLQGGEYGDFGSNMEGFIWSEEEWI